MPKTLFALACLAMLSASYAAMMAPAAQTTIQTSDSGFVSRTELGAEPAKATIAKSNPSGHLLWHKTEPIGIYNFAALGNKGITASFTNWLSAPKSSEVEERSGKVLWGDSASDNSVVFEVASAADADFALSAEWIRDGWNQTGVVTALVGGKPLWKANIPGSGAGLSSLAISADGKHAAVLAAVNNSYVVPGQGQLLCFDTKSPKATFEVNLPTGVFPGQITEMSKDLKVAFSANTNIYVADCSTGKIEWTYDRQYVSMSLALSADAEYVATSFETLQVFKKSGTTYKQYMELPLTTNGDDIWIGASTLFSPDSRVLALGLYDGMTAKQNRIELFDLAKKNTSWTYNYKPVTFQNDQDTPAAMSFTQDSAFLGVASWGDQNFTNPQIHVFCAKCGKVVFTYQTPGSMMALKLSSGKKGSVEVLAGGKHVHANMMGHGGDMFSFSIPPEMVSHTHLADDSLVLDDDEIQRLNSLDGMTWVAGRNERFEGTTFRDVRPLMGTKLAPVDSIKRVLSPALEDSKIPTEFDSTKAFKGCVHPVRDQQRCGSCWAFGASEVLSDRLCITSQKKGKKVNEVLSPEELVSCDKQDHGCAGGFLLYAWEFLESSGLVSDKCFPYAAGGGQAPACTTKCADGSKWSPVKVKNGTLQYFGSIRDVQTAIMTGGPIEVAFNVYSDFMKYTSGVYQRTPGSMLLGGHAVKLTGWGHDQKSGLDYWTVYNSWGTSWGLNGTFWIRRGVDECGIEYNNIWGEVLV